MKAILDPRQSAHDPKHFMANGSRLANPEQPRRIEVLKGGAEAAGSADVAVGEDGGHPTGGARKPPAARSKRQSITGSGRSPPFIRRNI